MSLPMERIIEAVAEAREGSPDRNFEQSFDLVINFREIDMNDSENRINLRLQLPNNIGTRKILVFASGDLALRSRRAGADDVIEPDELDQLATDKKAAKKRLADYDMFISEAPMMPTVGRVAGPILGPHGKMPTPVPPQADIDDIIERHRRTIVLRSRDKPFVHCIVGRETMTDDEIAQNIETVVNNISSVTKRGFSNIKTMFVKLTMGDSVKITG